MSVGYLEVVHVRTWRTLWPLESCQRILEMHHDYNQESTHQGMSYRDSFHDLKCSASRNMPKHSRDAGVMSMGQ